MSISIYDLKQNLADLNAYKDSVNSECRDAIERINDNVMEVIEKIDSLLCDFKR